MCALLYDVILQLVAFVMYKNRSKNKNSAYEEPEADRSPEVILYMYTAFSRLFI